ncbi:MAG: hypothetical protein KOO60_10880 [Gemmatimonadales bacterium]|nr:hypothetical protein [Gemmatimonadales bacterium]
MARKDHGPIPSRRHARRGAKSSVNLTDREVAYILADNARGRMPAQVRRDFNAQFQRNVSSGTITYQLSWNPERIAAYAADIAERGETVVLAEILGMIEPEAKTAPDAPFLARHAAQLPPDYRPRHDDLPAAEADERQPVTPEP